VTEPNQCAYRSAQGVQCVLGYDHNLSGSLHQFVEIDPKSPYRDLLRRAAQDPNLSASLREDIENFLTPTVERTILITVRGRTTSLNRWLSKVERTVRDHQHIDGTVQVIEPEEEQHGGFRWGDRVRVKNTGRTTESHGEPGRIEGFQLRNPRVASVRFNQGNVAYAYNVMDLEHIV
jgi:hypothetical protein